MEKVARHQLVRNGMTEAEADEMLGGGGSDGMKKIARGILSRNGFTKGQVGALVARDTGSKPSTATRGSATASDDARRSANRLADLVLAEVEGGGDVAVTGKIFATNRIASRLVDTPAFSAWLSKNRDTLDSPFVPRVGGDLLREMNRRRAEVGQPKVEGYPKNYTLREVVEAARAVLPWMDDEDDSMIAARLVSSAMVDDWASESTDGVAALAHQLAAADFHGTSTKSLLDYASTPSPLFPAIVREKRIAQSQKLLSENRDLMRELVRSEYEATQQFLRENGITEVTLFRGVGTKSPDVKSGDVVGVDGNPLSSWSTLRNEAVFFARGQTTWTDRAGGKRDGLVLEMTVPARMIQSLPVTGRGCLLEYEVVLAGFDGSAKVLDRFTGEDVRSTMDSMAKSGLDS
jgi:hypothetical protein